MSSSSKIVAATAGGHHILKIEGYSSTKSAYPCGQGVRSRPFTVGGHRWSIAYYSNGSTEFCPRYVSLYIVLEERVASAVSAQAQVSFASAAEERHRPVPCFPKKTKTLPIKSSERKLDGTYGMWGWAKFIKRADLEKSTYLVDDSFTVRCDIDVINGVRAEESAPAPAAPKAFVIVPPSDLGRHLRGLLETGSGADATFLVAGERLVAHRWLLAAPARSPTFSAQLLEQGGAASDVVRVEKIAAPVFKALLCFMYTDSLSLPETTTKQEEAAFTQHLLVVAHRYGMGRLKLLCEERLCGSIDVGMAANILALAEPLGCRGLKEACFDFLGRSPANLKAVMESDGFEHLSATCPSVLKELVNLGSASAPRLPSVIVAHSASNGSSINNISTRSVLTSSGTVVLSWSLVSWHQLVLLVLLHMATLCLS